jgi:hypothetical protein
MSTLLWIILGMFVGWNFPQPLYAKWIQNKVVNFFSNIGGSKKTDDK